MSVPAMKQALEALEMLARYENPETRIQVRNPKDGGPIVTMYPHKVATDAAQALRTAIAKDEKQEPYTEWLVCPICNHKSPYSPIKAKTNEEDAERVTKQARAALAREKQEPVAQDVQEKCRIEYVPAKGGLLPDPPAAQRQPLTDEQILADDTLRYHFGLNGGVGPVSKAGRKVIAAVEAAHGITGAAS